MDIIPARTQLNILKFVGARPRGNWRVHGIHMALSIDKEFWRNYLDVCLVCVKCVPSTRQR